MARQVGRIDCVSAPADPRLKAEDDDGKWIEGDDGGWNRRGDGEWIKRDDVEWFERDGGGNENDDGK